MELTINPQAVAFIIERAREFDAKVEPDDPDSGSNASDDKAIDVLEDFADDPTLEELQSAIEGLNEDESRDLVAIMWTGRGDYDKEQWSEAKAQANTIPPRDRSRYLIGTPLLADYLEEGLDALEIPVPEAEG
ncbi:MAG: DUF3775 domain-containing protein [Alphaproteobacteria bacterium]